MLGKNETPEADRLEAEGSYPGVAPGVQLRKRVPPERTGRWQSARSPAPGGRSRRDGHPWSALGYREHKATGNLAFTTNVIYSLLRISQHLVRAQNRNNSEAI